jgi:hypothetical protein
MTADDREIIGVVDLTPCMKPESCLQIIAANMDYVVNNFRAEWKKVKNKGSYDIDRQTALLRAFLQEWHGLFESDLYLIDYVEAKTGQNRGSIPGVYTMLRTGDGMRILVRGRPVPPMLLTEVTCCISDEINRRNNGEKPHHIKDLLSQLLRNKGYDVIAWQEIEV